MREHQVHIFICDDDVQRIFTLKGNEIFHYNKSRSTVKYFWRKFSNFWSRIEVWPKKERRRKYILYNYDHTI